MDPINNPYAPGAGQRPPELAGRDEQMRMFEVVVERIGRGGRPERSIVLTGLRGGVGKTVLLNSLRSAAVRAAGVPASSRPDPITGSGGRSRRRCMWRSANWAIPPPTTPSTCWGVIKSFVQRDAPAAAKLKDKWQPGDRRGRGDRTGRLRGTSRSTWWSC